MMPIISISKISRLKLASVGEQLDLSNAWLQTPNTGFCREEAQFSSCIASANTFVNQNVLF